MVELYCTSYCNQAHRVRDGKPIDHECYILPPKALELEKAGDLNSAIDIIRATPRKRHNGIRYGKH